MLQITNTRKKFFISYTLLFVLLSVMIFGNFFFNDKSLLRYSDSLNQYFYSLCYFGEHLRNIVSDLFLSHTFTIPMWDMDIGMGSDILTTLHYYVIGDPLNLLSVFFSTENMEYLFCGLIILRIYLAGLSFAYFCFMHKNSGSATLFGAVIYCFSGWALLSGLKYVSFLNPLIYFPLLLCGIDKIYQKEKPYLFIFATALAAVSNFYFFYMLSIFMFIYAVFRYFNYEKKFNIKIVYQWLVYFLGFYLIGLLLSSFILLPNINALLTGQRVNINYDIPLLYSLSYYLSVPLNMMIFWDFGGCGYTPFLLPSLIILFRKGKSNNLLKYGFILLLFFICIPYFGHFINGFSYVSNRWFWAFTMLAAYISVKAYPHLFELKKAERIVLCLVTLLLIPLWLIVLEGWFISLLLLFLTICFVVIGNILNQRKVYWKYAVFILLAVNIQVNCLNIYLDDSSAQSIANNVTLGHAYSALSASPYAEIVTDLYQTPNHYRYDQNFPNSLITVNLPMLLNTHSLQFYFSLAAGNITDFFNTLNVNAPCDFLYAGLDSRSILNTLSSVKYCMSQNDSSLPLPWGYSENPVLSNAEYSVYETDYSLPLGYTYSTSMSMQEWRKLSVIQQQYALLHNVVLEKPDFPTQVPVFNDKKMEYQIAESSGITFEENNKIITEKNATITLSFEGLSDSETYLMVENLDFMGDETSSDIKLTANNYDKSIRYFTNRYDQYSGKHNFICNLGYQEEPIDEITITFDKKGVYSFDTLSIVCQPTENFAPLIRQLQTNTLEAIEITDNRITGTITVDEPQILCLSIPYSKGWKIWVDGKEQQLQPANIMYMATELTAGSHDIRLQYCTPYLLPGLLLTFIGILLVVNYRFHLFSPRR